MDDRFAADCGGGAHRYRGRGRRRCGLGRCWGRNGRRRGDRRDHVLRGERSEGERGGGKKQSGGAAKLGMLLFHIEETTTDPS